MNYDPVEDEYGRPQRRLFSGRIKKRVRIAGHCTPLRTAALPSRCGRACGSRFRRARRFRRASRQQSPVAAADSAAAAASGDAVLPRSAHSQL